MLSLMSAPGLLNPMRRPVVGAVAAPSVTFHESEREILLEMAVPGLSGKDLKVTLLEDLLTIRYDHARQEGTAAEGQHGHDAPTRRSSFVRQAFERRFALPDTINQDKITARVENGVLSVVLAKHEPAPAPAERLIEIQ